MSRCLMLMAERCIFDRDVIPPNGRIHAAGGWDGAAFQNSRGSREVECTEMVLSLLWNDSAKGRNGGDLKAE